MNYHKPFRVQSKALRDSARGQNCTIRSAYCNADPSTTVFAHLRGHWSLGVATKPHDTFGVYACARCHDAMDRRIGIHGTVSESDKLRALYETQDIMLREGLIAVKGWKP